ncbi:hypothetical protein Tco_0803039 [Tanacetum coccineum]|uniref:Uncharacterized protein n=1 Tax=Tanacetum coccineum TaxID=301880 RepID=A0ABQ5A2Y3_9ASTR
MFEVSTIFDDDSAELVLEEEIGWLNVVTVNIATSSLFQLYRMIRIDDVVFGLVICSWRGAFFNPNGSRRRSPGCHPGEVVLLAEKIMGLDAALGFLKYSSNIVTTASAHRNRGDLEKISMVLAASTNVRLRLSTTPFCCAVRDGGCNMSNTNLRIKSPVFLEWMAFGGNTRDLGSFGEETDKITDLHQNYEEVLFTERGDGVTGIKRPGMIYLVVASKYLATASGSGDLHEDTRNHYVRRHQ